MDRAATDNKSISELKGSDEYHQTFVADRTRSVVDRGNDIVSGSLGLLTVSAYRRIARARSRKE